MTNEEKINLIGQKIMFLSNNLDKYQTELSQLKEQLDQLQNSQTKPQNTTTVNSIQAEPKTTLSTEQNSEPTNVKEEIPFIKIPENPTPTQQPYTPPAPAKQKSEFNFEEFIGGKLITFIGIAILVIGMGIGVKYAIDNDMLGPLGRIMLAYIGGGILLFIALRLKANYKSFSAVLLSGGMASLYFTTFIAYSFYGMFGQVAAFGIMVIFTMFTVFAATVYELEVIGIIGLVGAYAVPMLLSDGSGKIEIMFSYMIIVNIGILILSFKKYWLFLNQIAFAFTWLIFIIWFADTNRENHTKIALVFSSIFFIIFYISNMSYKIMKQEKFGVLDIVRLVSNSFIFFGIGYAALNYENTKDYLGAFTIANALVHFVFSFIVFKNKLLDRKLFYLLIALVLSFITIAVPVQLEGNWVTLLWAAEAVLLFTIGRYKAVRFYEWLGYIMILFSVFSLIQDWSINYDSFYYDTLIYKYWKPFFNIYLFTSLFVVSALGAMIYVHHKKELSVEEYKTFIIYKYTEYILPILLFLLSYYTFRNEISIYYQSMYENSMIKVPSTETWAEPGEITQTYDYSILQLKAVALSLYNILYFIVFSLLAIYKLKSTVVKWSSFCLNMLIAIGFITIGLNNFSSLDDAIHNKSDYYTISTSLGSLRYVGYILFSILMYLTFQLLKMEAFQKYTIKKIVDGCIIHFFILVILSVELVHLYTTGHHEGGYYANSAVYKLGFTSLWGIYSLSLIAYGIFKKNKTMRISAISLFGITLLKLFTYDTWDLSTGYKVIAYMLLGAILLVVAFLYQKFKVILFGDDKN